MRRDLERTSARALERRIERELEQLVAVAFATPRDLFDECCRPLKFADIPQGTRAALDWIRYGRNGEIVGFKFRDKARALAQLLAIATTGAARSGIRSRP